MTVCGAGAAAGAVDAGAVGRDSAAGQHGAPVSRRTALAGAAAFGAASLAVASCGTSAAPPSPLPAGTDLGAVTDIPTGSALVVAVAGRPVLLALTAAGAVVAHTAVCTHKRCTVRAQGPEAVCPCHGSTFDPQTGAVQRGPAEAALAPIAVSVVDGRVVMDTQPS